MSHHRQINRQRGHAAILFAMIVPVLFGLFSIATDGARMLQSKARMEDSLEAASLAVAAHNDDNVDDGTGAGSAVNQAIVRSWVDAYLGDANSIYDIQITKLNCEQIPDCAEGLATGDVRFFQFEVTASTNHSTWFQGDLAVADKTFDVAATGVSRKFQNHAVDVAFVSDFSGSMDNGWSGGAKAKYADLIDVIELVTVELQKFNDLENVPDNTVSFIGFNNMVNQVGGDGGTGTCYVDQLYRSWWSVNYTTTINNIFTVKTGCDYNSRAGDSDFHDITPTTNFTTFNQTVSGFEPGGWTASFQGIMRGAQMLDMGNNPRRLMIVLSDGADYSSSNRSISNTLVSTYGMCSVIRSYLDAQFVGEGEEITAVKSKIAVIGFDYDVDSNAALQNCAGVSNVYKAENKQDILNRILELISEEIGHLK